MLGERKYKNDKKKKGKFRVEYSVSFLEYLGMVEEFDTDARISKSSHM